MASLKETIMKANRDKSGKSSKAIRKAAEDRLKFKKKGGKTRNSLAEDAEKAVQKTKEAADRAKARKDSKAKAEKKPAKKKKKSPTSDLSISGAISKIRNQKHKNKTAGQ